MRKIILFFLFLGLSNSALTDNINDIRLFINKISTKRIKYTANEKITFPAWDKKNPTAQRIIMPKKKILKNRILQLHYVTAESLMQVIGNLTLGYLSAEGKAVAFKNNNLLFVHDDQRHLDKIRNMLARLDVPLPEVLLKAKIVDIDASYAKSLGVTYSNVAMDKGKESSVDQLTVPILELKDNSWIQMQITALEQEGHAKIESSPELIASDQHPALIETGEEIPYQQATLSGATSVTFKKAVLRLKVVPSIMPHHKILLTIDVNQDKVGSSTVLGVPTIDTQHLSTQALIGNRQTIVLGGIYQNNRSQQQKGVPVLRSLPIVGGLFRQQQWTRHSRELLIFLTSSIIMPTH